MIFDKSCAAFAGTPMGDWLALNKLETVNILVSHQHFTYLNSKFPPESKCCHDPEICVHATCVECPECRSFKTIRTTEPNEENVSEFECLDCKCFFAATNP